jgi:hypothetical protein
MIRLPETKEEVDVSVLDLGYSATVDMDKAGESRGSSMDGREGCMTAIQDWR